MGLVLVALDFRSAEDFEGLFDVMTKNRTEALVVLPAPTTLTHRNQLTARVAKNRIPAMYPFPEFADAGGLMAYGPSNFNLWRRGASYVDKILNVRKPTDLPVEQPMKFELVVNLKAGKQIGLTIPPNVLVGADRVIR